MLRKIVAKFRPSRSTFYFREVLNLGRAFGVRGQKYDVIYHHKPFNATSATSIESHARPTIGREFVRA
jgi:hypothetical protein